MKKRITAAFLAAAMMMAAMPAFAADDMESTLVTVKSRIDIPQELTEFRSGTYVNGDGTVYRFTWNDSDRNGELSVMADGEGHISSYSRYIDTDGEKEEFRPREEYYAAAEAFIKKAAPELFADENDRLVRSDENRVIRDNMASFGFERRINGIPVADNNASVVVRYTKGTYNVIDCNINWDYKAQTAQESGAEISAAGYYEVFPLETVYRKPVRLYYSTDGKDEEYQHIKEGDYVEALTNYALKVKSIDNLLLDELESMFVCMYTANVNATW